MAIINRKSLSFGKDELEKLIDEINSNKLNWNEAETRFQIIDRLIVDCLGWSRDVIRLEQANNREYSDYELGLPRKAIWEVKRETITFDFPANSGNDVICDMASLLEIDINIKDAVKQVQGYCINRGVELAVVTNGKQLIAFFATRTDGRDPLKCKCIAVNGYDQLLKKFGVIWQALSPEGVLERRLHRLLKTGEDLKIPEKLTSFLQDYPKHRYPSDLQSSLSAISELLLNDIIDQDDIEKQFYEDCYCESGALSQHALISKQMLSTRYQALFSNQSQRPMISPATQRNGDLSINGETIATSIRQRPIVLVGDVGVGKTSFIKHLMHVGAYAEFKDAIYIYINLGSQGALSENLKDFIISDIEDQLYIKYDVDVREAAFIRGVYASEINRFGRGIYSSLKETDPQIYQTKLMEFLEEKTKSLDSHLKESINHIAKARKKQIVIVLDNADQRTVDIQQQAFIISQNLSREWQAIVFVTVRPHTFFQSKKSGTLAAYPPRIFTILPPRVDQVIEKRLKFALEIAEGKITIQHLSDIKLNLENIAIFIRVLLRSLAKNDKLIEFLSNITGGNIREVIGFVTKFIGSPNIDAEKIINEMEAGGYIIPLHEFWKSALLGEYSHYDPISSMAFNLFDIESTNSKEHFLSSMILGYLNSDGRHKNVDGFVERLSIISEMQGQGFMENSIIFFLQSLNNKKLVETAERVTYDEGSGNFFEDNEPESFRLTTIGAYHLKRWISEFSYLDAMALDTPILDDVVREEIKQNVNSLSILHRYQRTILFRSYLTKAWHDYNLNPSYFNWDEMHKIGEESFVRVDRAITRMRIEDE